MSDVSQEPQNIHGYQIVLSGDRKVWAGKHDNSWYMRFDDGQGNERKLRLSCEAADALVSLITTAPQEIHRYVLTMEDGEEMKWEKFEPQLVDAPSPQVTEEQP